MATRVTFREGVRSRQRTRDRLILLYARLFRHRGHTRILRRLTGHRRIVAPVQHGVILKLGATDVIEHSLLIGHDYEPITLDFLQSNLRPGERAVFAGVNFGLHLIVGAVAVGARGAVLGVEPQPSAIQAAWQNVELNNVAPQTLLVCAGLGAEDRLIRVPWSQPVNSGAASFLDSGSGYLVGVSRLETILSFLEWDSVRLALLDVQGFELEALKGFGARIRPEILVVEFDPTFLEKAGVTPSELATRLDGMGYDLADLFGRRLDSTSDLPSVAERNVVAFDRRLGVIPRYQGTSGGGA